MKFGLSYNTGFLGTDPANLMAIARHADDLGFESFYVPEHVAPDEAPVMTATRPALWPEVLLMSRSFV